MVYRNENDNRYRVNFMRNTEELIDTTTKENFIAYLEENAEFEDNDNFYIDGKVVSAKVYCLHETETLSKKYSMRYVDDIVVFGSNKKELHKMHKAIEKYLAERLHLKIKENWQVFRFEYKGKGRPLDFMGWKFYREKTILRKSIYTQIMRKAKRVGNKTTIRGAYGMVSYMGYIKHTNTYGAYMQYIRPFVNIGKLKRFIAKRARLQNGKEKVQCLATETQREHKKASR